MTPVLHDGRPADAATAASRALHYGDGVFRTLLWSDGAVDWPLHVDKLGADCRALDLDMPDAGVLAREVRTVVAGAREAVVKLIVARAPGARGYMPAGSASERWVFAYPATALEPEKCRRGIVAIHSPVILSDQPLLAGVKHLNRLEQVLASRGWPDGADEALMGDSAGRLIGGTRSNLFCVRDGELLTPRLDRCGVAGIMRRRVLDAAATLGLKVIEAELPVAALIATDEAFICNAVIGLWPLRCFEQRFWPAPGPFTRKLMRALGHPRIPTDLS